MASDSDGNLQANRRSDIGQRDEHVRIVLPCDVSRFGEFISGLLGTPQISEGVEIGTFDIGVQDIANVYHLITQRIAAQNEESLVNFSIKVYYDNGNSIAHKSVDAFSSYHPVEPCYPTEVVLSFTYLISFKSRSVPEKQIIEVSFAAEEHSGRQDRRRYYSHGAIEHRIEYTERTWGTDISTLLKNHAKTLMSEQDKFVSWMATNTDELATFISVGAFVTCFGGWTLHFSKHVDSLIEQGRILQYVAWSAFIFLALASFLFLIRYLFINRLYIARSSFIVLVESDRKSRDERKRRQGRKMMVAIGGWVLDVVAGIVATFIYTGLAS